MPAPHLCRTLLSRCAACIYGTIEARRLSAAATLEHVLLTALLPVCALLGAVVSEACQQLLHAYFSLHLGPVRPTHLCQAAEPSCILLARSMTCTYANVSGLP